MFFVMVEISNFRQLSRLRDQEASDIRGLLEHFSQNRGGRLLREQNGFFLFGFHPLREKVLDQVSDFLFLTAESLKRKQDDLFGFSLLLDREDAADDAAVFTRLKGQVFLVPRENSVWAAPGVLPLLAQLFPVTDEQPLAEILGPPVRSALPPLSVEHLVEITGWIDALKVPLGRQLANREGGRTGKILRLKGTHLPEKYFVLRTVLHQLYGSHEDFPVLFPILDSRDFLSQLLARVDPDVWKSASETPDPAWTALLENRGGGDYPGDSGRSDVVGALAFYFRAVIRHLGDLGLPPVFVFLFPRGYVPVAQEVLVTILSDLVANHGLHLLVLEHAEGPADFLADKPSLSWSFPGLSLERITRERDARGWRDRFPVLDPGVLERCGQRGMAWVHHLWAIQEGRTIPEGVADPSLALLQSLDSTHHKVYYALWAGRGLLEVDHLVAFLQEWGEDASVVADKVASLRAMGFFLEGLDQPLRSDFGPWLAVKLGQEGRELLAALGKFLHRRWSQDRRLSEVLYLYLRNHGLLPAAVEVLSFYLTNKINQGQGNFLPLLRRDLWEGAPTEELRETLRLVSAAAKLRFALNIRPSAWAPGGLDPFRRSFTRHTDDYVVGEWQLQQGRFKLKTDELTEGFTLLKKSLLEAQNRHDLSLEVRAEAEIGLALMRKNRLEEGREYFDIAGRLAEKTGSTYLTALTAGLDAVALFLMGHLAGAAKAADRGWQAADRGGLQQFKVYQAFLAGRIAFDLGDYSRAVGHFETALGVARRYNQTAAGPVLGAWKGRAEAYSGNSGSARATFERIEPSAERSFFLAEACYLDRDLAGARTRIREAVLLVKPTRPFGCGERADWLSGYGPLEDRGLAASGQTGVLQNQIEAFAAFLEGQAGNHAEGQLRFQEILGRKFLLDLDPASAQIYFWAYLTVPKNDSSQEAYRLTLLGRALKDVQVRSSRIEDPAQRQDFLSKPHWNAQFGLEARKLKLM